MKIVSRDTTKVLFGTLAYGDVFKANSRYWMKIDQLSVCDMDIDYVNAVTLDYGDAALFAQSEKVTPINAEIVIKPE